MEKSNPKYIIKPYSYQQAEKLGVHIFPSDNPKKKIEVYDSKGEFICYIGDSQYLDYPSYMELEERGLVPKGYAKQRRQLYRIRHGMNMNKIGTPSFYASRILW